MVLLAAGSPLVAGNFKKGETMANGKQQPATVTVDIIRPCKLAGKLCDVQKDLELPRLIGMRLVGSNKAILSSNRSAVKADEKAAAADAAAKAEAAAKAAGK